MATFLGIFITLSLGPLALLLIFQSVHKSQTVDNTKIWDYGTFADFMKEFKARQWEHNNKWPESWFDVETNSQIHADILKFSGKGMVLRLPSYIRYMKFVRDNKVKPVTTSDRRRKGLWLVK